MTRRDNMTDTPPPVATTHEDEHRHSRCSKDERALAARDAEAMGHPSVSTGGSHCRHGYKEVRLYPLGSGGNLRLCPPCFTNENLDRYKRAKEAGHPEDCPQISWSTAEVVYDKHGKPAATRLDFRRLTRRRFRSKCRTWTPRSHMLAGHDERNARWSCSIGDRRPGIAPDFLGHVPRGAGAKTVPAGLDAVQPGAALTRLLG
jgi:hypothetical protein